MFKALLVILVVMLSGCSAEITRLRAVEEAVMSYTRTCETSTIKMNLLSEGDSLVLHSTCFRKAFK
jgi:uncharacterized protein YceK